MVDDWIQRGDFRAEDATAAGADELCHAFEAHDWAAELQHRQALEATAQESCDPGFGVVLPGGNVLHLCPDATDSVLCHYRYTIHRRILGPFPAQRQESATWSEAVEDACALIRLFFEQRHEELLQRSRRGA